MVRKEESLIGGSCPHGGGVAEKRMVMEAEAPVLAPRCPLVVEAKGQKTDPQLFTSYLISSVHGTISYLIRGL